MIKNLVLLLVIVFINNTISAQNISATYDFNMYSKINDSLYSTQQRVHTSIKPFLISDTIIQAAFDTAFSKKYKPLSKNLFIKKIFNEHLIELNKYDYSLYLDFLPDFQIGKDISGHQNTWLNTRGFQVGGRIGKKFIFQSSYFENQSKFPLYLSNYIAKNTIVPGQGYANSNAKGVIDYAYTDAIMSYQASKFFTAQVGYGKNFIGDGYRSLLLSDNAFNYPFIKTITTIGPLRLVNIWATLTDLHNSTFNDINTFPTKTGVFQYIDWSANKNLTLGFFQNIMIMPKDFTISYLNPLLFLRSINFAEGSPGKLLLGFNGSYKIKNKYAIYGQLAVNEFLISKILKDKGSWLNKQGYQLGVKGFNFLNVKHLNVLAEFNSVRPFTYSANNELINYGHYQQSLAHPLGSNFREALAIVNYSYKRIDLRAQANYSFYGADDPLLPQASFGQDIYKPYTQRTADEGYFIGSGIATKLYYIDLKAAYVLNYKNNLRIELSYINRYESNKLGTNKTNYFSFGLKSSFRNLYYDF